MLVFSHQLIQMACASRWIEIFIVFLCLEDALKMESRCRHCVTGDLAAAAAAAVTNADADA